MGHTSMSQFHTGWRLMVTVDYDGVSTKIDDWYMVHGSYEHVPILYEVVTLFKANSYYRL